VRCFFGEPVKDSVDLSAFPTTQDQPKTRIAEACAEIDHNTRILKKGMAESRLLI
jgi:hypothetical protein